MMVMMVVTANLAGAGLEVLRERGKRFLSAGKVIRLQGALQALIICIGLGVLAERLVGLRSLAGLGGSLDVLLQGRKGGLGRGEVVGLKRARKGLEVLLALFETGLVDGLVVWVGRR